MLIDTSRNGWGGSARPTGAEHVDRRGHVRQPVAASTGASTPATGATSPAPASASGRRRRPAAGIDAYVWVKPPGESDGSSTADPERRGQGLRPDVRPDLHRQRPQRQQHDRRAAERPAVRRLVLRAVPQLMANAYPALS